VPEGEDWKAGLAPDSLEVIPDAKVEPCLADVEPGYRCQFERKGYFIVDPDTEPGRPVFNLTAGLRDEWAKIQQRKGK